MPIYEYKCKLCADTFDVEQRITDAALTSLPGCDVSDGGDHVLRKVFSAVGISFKGDGFYRNDARSKKSSTSSSTSSSDNGSSSSSSSDSTSSAPSDSSSSSSASTSSGSSNGGSGSKAGASSSSGSAD